MAIEGKMNRSPVRDLLIVAAAGLVTILAIVFFAGRLELQDHPLLGKPAPEIEYEIKAGKKATLSNQKGTTVLLNFWASWCAPCMEEMPSLVALENHFRSDGLVVLAFNIEEPGAEDIAGKITGNTMPRNLIFNFKREHMRPYGVDTIPLSVIVDKKGVVRKVMSGPRYWMDINLLKELEKIIKE